MKNFIEEIEEIEEIDEIDEIELGGVVKMDGVEELERSFRDVWKRLGPKEQEKAMRKAMRRESSRLRMMAVRNMRATGIGRGTRSDLSKGIRARVYPEGKGVGFMLTVKPYRKKGYHRNRQGLEKPVLMWAEDGTDLRRTKTKTRVFVRLRKGHRTGRMDAGFFMARTEEQGLRGVEQNLFKEFRRNVEKVKA